MHSENVVIVGNGPSASELSAALHSIPEPRIIVRLNFFFLETENAYGPDVDYYFWAVNRPRLHDELRRVVQGEEYKFHRFLCPVPLDLMDYTEGKVNADPFWEAEPPEDHWATIASVNPNLARIFMSRPLPTAGLQALAYFACKGYSDIHLFGMDFYQSADKRYAYDIPKDIASDLGSKHTTPGYEAGAHSLDGDLSFLRSILQEYPHLNLSYNGYFDKIGDILAEPRQPSEHQISDLGGKALVRDLTGDMIDRSSFSRLQAALKNAEDRLENIEQKYDQINTDLAHLDKQFYQTNAAFYRLFATEGMPYSDVLWVVHEMSSLAGVHRPLSAFLETADLRKQARPKVINLSDPDRVSVRYTADYLLARPHRLILNSVACFEDSRVELLVSRSKQRAIYLHETEWTISEFSKKNPRAYQVFRRFLKDATVFCVSQKQKTYVEEKLGVQKAVLVYNTVDTMLSSSQRKMRRALSKPKTEDSPLRVGMVGSYQPRKGSQLFTAVAETLRAVSSNISFEWVGKHHAGQINKNAITFHGPMPPEKTQAFIDDLDVLFLPSFDDPQPLAALEALSRGVKLVCFEGIGTAEWVAGISGCEVFSDYSTEAAVTALEAVMTAPFDHDAVDRALASHFDPVTFTEALCSALDDMAPDHEESSGLGKTMRQHFKSLAKESVITFTQHRDDQVWDQIGKQVVKLREDPGDVLGYFQLARRLQSCQETALAERILQMAVRNNEGKASVDREMAIYLTEEGRPAEALEHAQKAVEGNPKSAAAQKVLKSVQDALARTA
ncbi:glycosyltransferase family 4 protein [Parasedimentitalea huanghaiensis]|uniref:Glycosyltransferase n=1 Tax=Parasedimentitalea huanghaiensis TaxID=2682100 RepID=A0A6L6WN96_9RHOB|nr:glycosyltransferase family 4 protein [Zongyanglinia huanghaiensis]MVO18519.1 glycosyltransferase [Zongyanglinia huanghaiensis]